MEEVKINLKTHPIFVCVCDDISFFGIESGNFKLEQLTSLETDISDEINLLRHFKEFNPKDFEQFIGADCLLYDKLLGKKVPQTVSTEMLKNLLQVKGSKFNSKIEGFQNPKTVINSIKNIGSTNNSDITSIIYTPWLQKPNHDIVCHIKVSFSKVIGFCGLLNINDMSWAQKEKLSISMRGVGVDAIPVKTIDGKYTPSSNLIIMLKKIGRQIRLVSAYPGVFGPPMPNLSLQTEAEYTYSKNFWDDYYFVNEL